MNNIMELVEVLIKEASKETVETALGVCLGILTCESASKANSEKSHE